MPKPFPFQEAQVEHALGAPGPRWLFADEMGLGKTLQCILAARHIGCDNIVVIAPALARMGWRHELGTWWPEAYEDPNRVAMVDMSPTRKSQSKKRAATWEEVLTRPARIVSPELLNAKREREHLDAGKHPCLILDEGHMYADPGAKRSKELRKLTKGYKGCLFAATATPVPNRPIGAWNLFDMVWPRRFGTSRNNKPAYGFSFRYVEREYNEYGSVPGGLSAEFGDELRERLEWMMSRTTRKEAASLLPPCQLRALSVDPQVKLQDTVREWTERALEEASHVVILTHRRKTAKDLAGLLVAANPEVPVVHIDGGVPPGARNERLAALREHPKGVLVSTMHAVARAISLSWCARGLLAELYWSPEKLTQVVGRFARLDGHLSSVVDVLCGANSVQERIAHAVSDKLWDNKQLLSEGAAEAGLSEVLGGTEEDLEEAIRNAAMCVCSDEELEALSALSAEEW